MLKVGIFLIALGATAYVLPLFHLRNWIIGSLPAEMQPYAGGVLIGIGVLLSVIGLKKGKKKDEKK